ncbi:uncharacterized protein LOC125420680 [Ziziphus jujuba]|uniref:Uncharacterized protein LOC125420680 n=1 Tax=Ziziphus jujuba TaxID=326968 RepID=A0ABM3ZZC1_ZIZJJ|nr:uncharacterized protein LOC125420680 [Ziziphus jujuba]
MKDSKLFLWRLISNTIPSKEVLVDRLRGDDVICEVCGAELEIAFHVFKECQGIRMLAFASRWGCKIDQWKVNSVKEMVEFCVEPRANHCFIGMDKELITVFLATLFYASWNFRNELRFQGAGAIRKAVLKLQKSFQEKWSVPAQGWWKLNTDAAYSDGKAGLAFVARDSNGEIKFLTSKSIKRDSPYEAKLQAMKWASACAEDKGWNFLE